MSLPWSLRGRLLVGAALWTVGLFFLAIVLWHVTLGNRHPPALMTIVFDTPPWWRCCAPGSWSPACSRCGAAGRRSTSCGPGSRAWTPAPSGGWTANIPARWQPLVGDLNALLDQRERSLARARAKAGDLAHGLKTPLAVLVQEADRADAAGQPELGDAIRQQVERMRRQVDYQLAQAGPTPRPRSAPAPRRPWPPRQRPWRARCVGCTPPAA